MNTKIIQKNPFFSFIFIVLSHISTTIKKKKKKLHIITNNKFPTNVIILNFFYFYFTFYFIFYKSFAFEHKILTLYICIVFVSKINIGSCNYIKKNKYKQINEEIKHKKLVLISMINNYKN